MVRLHKENQDKYAGLFEEAGFEDLRLDMSDLSDDPHLPATRDMIGTLVIQYNEALKSMKETMVAARRLGRQIHAVRGKEISVDSRTTADYVGEHVFCKDFAKSYNEFVEKFTEEAWTNVINMAGLNQLMTNKVRQSFASQIQQNKTLAFTVANIVALAEGLRANMQQIMTDTVEEVFDTLTAYHYENRVHVEGWKTNDQYKVKRKFILPHIVEHWEYGFMMGNWSYGENVRDIDRVLCNLEGRKVEDVVTIHDALRASLDKPEQETESEFFHIKYYKKGTAHFTFKDKDLHERFCIVAAKNKNWLPHDYSYEEHGPIPEKGDIPLVEGVEGEDMPLLKLVKAA